jgi:membrane-bound serine protease (ClpP class)
MAVFSSCVYASPAGAADQGRILVITVNGIINPVSAEHIGSSIKESAEMGAEVLVIELDTPGGLDTSMRNIVKGIIASSVPVIVYVSPSGSRAASAGVFVTMAAHIAAMSPGTNIGAAHPVAVGGTMDNVSSEKAANDAAAYIRSLAEQRGRNAEWAEASVRKSVSVSESDALKKHVIDLMAKDLGELLKAVDGRTVVTAAGIKTLSTAGAKIVRKEIGFRHRVLDLISNPNVAYILMLLGFYGLFFELTNPGAVAPGVIGSICLILAFYSFQTLPVNYAGVLLIIVGIILFILEIKVVSYGMLSIGGIASIVLGSMMTFESPLPFLRVSLSVVLPAAAVTALFFIFTFRLAYKAYRNKPVTGSEGMVGLEGSAHSEINSSGGTVMVHGEYWSAFSDEPIGVGQKVVVESVKGLSVRVKKHSGA